MIIAPLRATVLVVACLLTTTCVAQTPGGETPTKELHPVAADVKGGLADPEAPFVMVVRLNAKPGLGGEVIAAMKRPSTMTAKEPGNLQYDLSRSTKDPDAFVLYEHWKSIDALDTHLKTPYLKTLLADFGRLLAEPPDVTVFVPVPPAKAVVTR